MKRRAISIIIVLALCLSLCPTRALAAAAGPTFTINVYSDEERKATYIVSQAIEFALNGSRYTYSDAAVIRVESAGSLYLLKTGGTIASGNGAGVEVAGGSLYVEDPDITVSGTTCGLDISSGSTVRLSGGTFSGGDQAIQAGDYGALLADGYAFFDDNGPVPLDDVAGKTSVTVKLCTDHVYAYTDSSGAPMNCWAHSWRCLACGAESSEPEMCSFDFGTGDVAQCVCGHTIRITMDEDSLVYDGTSKPASGDLLVVLDDTGLTEGTDYDLTVEPSPCINAGEFTVTITGRTYSGTFTKTYRVDKDTPEITWNPADGLVFDYEADETALLSKVEAALLQCIDMEVNAAGEVPALKGSLEFSYRAFRQAGGGEDETGTRAAADAGFTGGLPTNAGIYEIKAALPVQTNYEAAETEHYLKLTINKIDPIKNDDVPVAAKPTYNGSAQRLVTGGTVWDGAVILFATSDADDAEWSETIPTGIDAGEYTVWYKVEETDNYNSVEKTQVENVIIKRKAITPTVELEYYTCGYNGEYKQPKVTVMDGDTVLPKSEYKVAYENNRSAGTARVIVTDVDAGTDTGTGNYDIARVEVEFEITAQDQETLTITNKPNIVTYGDVFTLETSGGSGNGAVTWTITAGENTVATVDSASGQITVKDIGTATVKATKDGAGDHEDATAEWSFTVVPKQVTATVTAGSRTYKSGDATATVKAEVKNGLLSGDTITIDGLEGTFSDDNAGTGKTVTVDISKAVVTGDGELPGGPGTHKYIVTIPNTPVTADITPKEVTPVVALQLSNAGYVYDGGEKKPAVTVTYVETAQGGAEVPIPSTEYTVAYSNHVNAGEDTAVVTVAAKAGGNYTFANGPVEKTFSISKANAELTSAPQANDLTYNGNLQNLVTEGRAVGGTVWYSLTGAADSYGPTIPQGDDAKAYTVYYMVKGDSNHNDIDATVSPVALIIKPKTVTNPVIELGTYDDEYDGEEKEPEVIRVRDGGTVIWEKGETAESSSADSVFTITYSSNVNAGTATVRVVSKSSAGNYIVDGSATFEITKADVDEAEVVAPTEKADLTYNGSAQELINKGSSPDGRMVYALDNINGNYSEAVPTATAVGDYAVYYKVLGDSNHNDSVVSESTRVEVSIAKNKVTNPTITLSSDTFRYNGSQQIPTVSVRDDNRLLIAEHEYKVEIKGTGDNNSMVKVDTYTVKITAPDNSNYTFEADTSGVYHNTATYQIVEADQDTISITGMRDKVYYGDTIQLGITGGTGEGTVTWSIAPKASDADEPAGAADAAGTTNEISETGGLLTINEVGGPYVVTATRTAAGGNYSETSATWEFNTRAKPVTAILTGVSKTYDRNTKAEVNAKVDPGDLVSGDRIVIKTLEGQFKDANVGTGKEITITSTALAFDEASSRNWKNYAITYSDTATADIWPKQIDALSVTTDPVLSSAQTYTGRPIEPEVISVTYQDGDGADIPIGSNEYTKAYRDNVNVGTAYVIVTNVEGGNYRFNWSGPFVISEAVPTVVAPTEKTNLTYNGAPQALVNKGSSPDGTMVYRLGTSGDFDEEVPTAIDAGDYTVYYMVEGDSNHSDSAPVPLPQITINKAAVDVSKVVKPTAIE